MKFIKTSIPEVVLIKPNAIEDYRGYFVETFRQDEFNNKIGYEVNFLQENETISVDGVNGPDIILGSLSNVSTNGNWPTIFDATN